MRTMQIQDFDPREIKNNTKEALQLDVTLTPAGTPIRQTILMVRGTTPDPVLLVSGGVHGDEFEGPLAIMRLFKELQPADITGTFMGLVVANVPAFEAATRCSPIDGLNLARVFPGDPNGSVTQQIAYWMGERCIGKADYYIDLHSSGSDTEMVRMCGYTIMDSEPAGGIGKQMAEAFHTQVVWAHPDQAPGRTTSYAMNHNIPFIYTECPPSRCANPPDVEIYQRGVRNVMRVVGMLDGGLEGEPSPYYLFGSGNVDNVDTVVSTKKCGFFVPERLLLDWVEAGDMLGTVHSLAGDILEEIRAPSAGYVALRHLLPRVYSGQRVFLVVDKYEP